MIATCKHKTLILAVAACGVAASASHLRGAAQPACDPDNSGITLPAGFCALVVANDVGTARHMAVAANGDLYVATQSRGGRGQPESGGGVVALHDADGDGKFETREQIGTGSTTGVALRNGYLYLAHPVTIERFKMTAGQLKPGGAAETIVTGLPAEAQHRDKGIALMNPADAVARADGVAQGPDGALYIADSQKGKIWRVIYKGAN